MTIIEQIELLRETAKISRADLCKAASVSTSLYYKLVKGTRKEISYSKATALMEALGKKCLWIDKKTLDKL